MPVSVIIVLLLSVAGVQTQEQTQEPAQPSHASSPTATPLTPAETIPDEQTPPIATANGTPLISKNKAYNLARAAEGRLGVRLGDDMSYRITGN